MLELHRASAGSGKTYTLAKKYIWFLITIKPEERGARPRLRTDAELADSARHILAMTFTNKATNEMQQRIVMRLHDLAHTTPEWTTAPDGSLRVSKPDYLEDFIKDIHGVSSLSDVADPQGEAARIASICGKALAVLLENYSDFKVSTIDSFFQLVLRTLAYETDLNDSYQVELDSEFLSRMAVDGTLEEIDSDTADTTTPFWIKVLMDRDKKGWNIFSRNATDGFGSSPYRDFVESVKRLENEEYKMKRKKIDDYFRSNPDMVALYRHLSEKYDRPLNEAFARLQDIARQGRRSVPAELRSISARSSAGKIVRALRELSAPSASAADEALAKHLDNLSEDNLDKKSTRTALADYPDFTARVRDILPALREAAEKWLKAINDPGYRHWRLYSANLPYLALFGITARKRREYLEETNSVELSETATILSEIIDDSDTPFVYERLGSVLNHFLIDEFQDTSRLQWINLRPLLSESIGRGNDNLIIGDAKQSIYRFRNADPSLITTDVPADFGADISLRGERCEENTNYRSALRVVQFNNSFFDYYVRRLDRVTALGGKPRMLFAPLYSNVVQTAAKKAGEGYVEITVYDPKSGWQQYVLTVMVSRVAELIKRGYRQRDIAVLVDRHSEGEAVIKAFSEYNSSLPEGERHIGFVSEQSLKVANSKAVKLIVGVLENMARGFNPKINEGDDRRRYGVGRWEELRSSFQFFELGSGGTTMAERLDEYLATRPEMNLITEVFESLQSLAIPALVESVVASFMPETMRREEAVFIAAFQDLVLEYCESHPTDIGSFLQWWRRRSMKASIASPEETDAVRVLTIHKSKGLEYDCVLIPFANWDMDDSPGRHQEWRWVEPAGIESDGPALPPFIPVNTNALMENTLHERLLTDYFDQMHMDALNKAYVAFTRAGRELYIFTCGQAKKTKKGDGDKPVYPSVGAALHSFMEGDAGADTPVEELPRNENEGYVVYSGCIGSPLAPCEHEEQQPAITLSDYRSNIPGIQKLKTRPGNMTASLSAQEEGDNASESVEIDAEDLDPRSEGNLKHAVLELVKVREDLPKAVRHMAINGLLTPEMARDIESDLINRLDWPPVERWFDGSARVITERPLLQKGEHPRRPDRILLYPDGHAEIVDYKFGQADHTGRYRRQVRRYMQSLARTGRFTRVEGYIWYVNDFTIDPC